MKKRKIKELADLLEAANSIYRWLLETSINDSERQDWQEEADDVARALLFARCERDHK